MFTRWSYARGPMVWPSGPVQICSACRRRNKPASLKKRGNPCGALRWPVLVKKSILLNDLVVCSFLTFGWIWISYNVVFFCDLRICSTNFPPDISRFYQRRATMSSQPRLRMFAQDARPNPDVSHERFLNTWRNVDSFTTSENHANLIEIVYVLLVCRDVTSHLTTCYPLVI